VEDVRSSGDESSGNTGAGPHNWPAKRLHVRKDKTNPRRLAYVLLLLFATPPGGWLLAPGLLLVLAAVLFHGWAAGYLARAGYAEREKVLTVRGPYRHNRNPYYVAQLTMDLGSFCLAGLPLFYLLYFPIIFSVYRRWVHNEEGFLKEEFGDDYRAFMKEVPRWGLRLRPAAPRGHEQSFDWPTYRLNRELHRSLSHLFLCGVFVCYYLFGNPFASVAPLTRVTVAALIAGWLIVHDMYPVDATRLSPRWLAAAGAGIVFGFLFLSIAPVWEPWSGAASAAAILSGLALGLLVTLTSFPFFSHATGKEVTDEFVRPMCQWYAAGVGLGLFTCTTGGVWLGILLPLIAWTLGVAGLIPLSHSPQKNVVGVTLLAVFSLSGLLALGRLLS